MENKKLNDLSLITPWRRETLRAWESQWALEEALQGAQEKGFIELSGGLEIPQSCRGAGTGAWKLHVARQSWELYSRPNLLRKRKPDLFYSKTSDTLQGFFACFFVWSLGTQTAFISDICNKDCNYLWFPSKLKPISTSMMWLSSGPSEG